MAKGAVHVAGCVSVLLVLSYIFWPASPASSLRYGADRGYVGVDGRGFDPATATLLQVQVVFRHGARTPLNELYSFPGASWTKCRGAEHYPGVDVVIKDENGEATPPPILDTNTPALPGGCTQGTLTEAGYGMAKKLGAWLRERYVDQLGFLPRAGAGPGGASDRSVANLRSTMIRRTVATLRGVLTALWPDLAAGGQPPLQVSGSREALEIMYGNNNTCSRLPALFAAMERDLEAADARDSELPRLNRMVAEALGLDPTKTINWPKLYDTLVAMQADGLALPPGATKEVLDVVWAQAERHEAAIIGPGTELCASLGPGGAGDSSARRARCREVLRLDIGLLLHRLAANMATSAEYHLGRGQHSGGPKSVQHGATAASGGEDAAQQQHQQLLNTHHKQQHHRHVLVDAKGRVMEEQEGQQQQQAPPPKLFLYSGHDSSVTPLLAVLGQPATAWPPYTASVVFELWQAGGPMTRAGALASSSLSSSSSSSSSSLGRRGGGVHHGASGAVAGGGEVALGQEGRRLQGAQAGAAGGASERHWVRILYLGEPLVVPGLSSRGGWIPLGVLRERVLLPLAISPERHARVCARTDLSDLYDSGEAAAAEAREEEAREEGAQPLGGVAAGAGRPGRRRLTEEAAAVGASEHERLHYI